MTPSQSFRSKRSRPAWATCCSRLLLARDQSPPTFLLRPPPSGSLVTVLASFLSCMPCGSWVRRAKPYFFATAPFLGAVAAIALLGERLGGTEIFAAVLMAVGVVTFQAGRTAQRPRCDEYSSQPREGRRLLGGSPRANPRRVHYVGPAAVFTSPSPALASSECRPRTKLRPCRPVNLAQERVPWAPACRRYRRHSTEASASDRGMSQ